MDNKTNRTLRILGWCAKDPLGKLHLNTIAEGRGWAERRAQPGDTIVPIEIQEMETPNIEIAMGYSSKGARYWSVLRSDRQSPVIHLYEYDGWDKDSAMAVANILRENLYKRFMKYTEQITN